VSLNVNETGTQAVGSSSQAFTTGDIYVPKVDLYIDRPFIYLIRDIETDAILFLGRVVDPR
jgi:serpin B